MSLDIVIRFKEPRRSNYYLEHPYIYDGETSLSCKDRCDLADRWVGNITHNLRKMASNIPIVFNGKETTLYQVCWHPEQIGVSTVGDIRPLLIQGLHYMIDHRKELERFNPPNGWGSYNGFMKFLLNYKQACEDNDSDCTIEASR